MSLLHFENVSRWFPSSHTTRAVILNSISFSLNEGRWMGLIGPSGVGKTTLLHLAAGLDTPNSGQVTFCNQDWAKLTSKQAGRLRRRRIGIVFQNNLCLSALSVWENVALPKLLEGESTKTARQEALRLLDQLELVAFSNASVTALSGGQRRRLGIARALAANPNLILADEPTADLDAASAKNVLNLFSEWVRQEGKGLIIATHDLTIIEAADQILHLQMQQPNLVDSTHTTSDA